MNKEIERVFALDGELAQHFNQFTPRQGQTEMADACFQTLREGGELVAEAGTGIGKTFAYGVAALLSGRKVIISTASKALQDQLSKRDLPALCQALSVPAKIQVLKGRDNYVCQQRLQLHIQHLALTNQKGLQAAANEVKHWAMQTQTGELTEVLGQRSHPLWDKVCARSEFCALVECDSERCAYPQQRKDAEEADVIVINHHLLGADLALAVQGLPKILPERPAIVIDEAHQLADVMTQALGQNASTLSWGYALRELQAQVQTEIKDMPVLVSGIEQLLIVLADWQASALHTKVKQSAEAWLSEAIHKEKLNAFIDQWRVVVTQLAIAADRSPTIKAQASVLGRLAEVTLAWQHANKQQIAWIEGQNDHWFIYITPLSIADTFIDRMRQHYSSMLLTSATLSAGGDFSHLQRQLGLWDAQCQQWLSPFNYEKQALLYLPEQLPEPQSETYTVKLMRRIWPLLLANGGKAFLLFTSYKAMQLAAETIRPHCPFPLLVQGEQDAHQLIAQFRQKGNAVLCATASFWEGVDVAGEALSLVVIDKIPFSPPDDPVTLAREQDLQEKGLSVFVCEQLPSAIMTLVQGAGRLIRSETDRGVLVIGDTRLSHRRYGQQILKALPPMRQTREQQQALAFIQQSKEK